MIYRLFFVQHDTIAGFMVEYKKNYILQHDIGSILIGVRESKTVSVGSNNFTKRNTNN